MGRKKEYFIILDSESTNSDKVADLGVILCDRKGNIINSFACLVRGIYDNRDEHTLFNIEGSDPLWSKSNLDKRYQAYDSMLDNGSRIMASVGAINNWLMMAKATYDPILTAYNLSFDVDKCQKTGINLAPFDRRFCLWQACATAYGQTAKYKRFILENHLFKVRTKWGNMTYPTNADVMAKFVRGIDLPDEPHLAYEDVLGYEKPLLDKLLTRRSIKWLLSEPRPYDWRKFQVRDHFKPCKKH
jgi:hypothetical protein